MWHIVFFIYVVLLIRLISMVEIGPASYGHRMAQLQNGTFIERTTARVMQMDPLSQSIALRIRVGMKRLGIN
ncbi:hypothetical protein AIOL_004287 [Candidatus Rhodobacter oscarellae]|uniref:Uncharacterized protein n=2 Tax=Candidatus Rhodobacter oscarellae TaxID=1675527 RepID=A0A0J9E935_9RHOB|nr:hypothetical protein AIOL_004287 [Candidatus Rhodobacter lobularis]